MTAFEDLSLLRAFISIVECGSISAGARRLRITQPTLSRQLQTLEERCGLKLLRRDTHGMNVTEAGRGLLEDARAMIRLADEADRRMREDHTALSGHLRIFATVDLGQWLITPLVSRFLQLHPKVTASLALTNRPLHMMREGSDVGILPGKITDESLIARPAGTISLHLAAAASLVKTRPAVKGPDELKSWPWVALAGSQFWSSKEIHLIRRTGTGSGAGGGSSGKEHTIPISPVLISEGVTSVREAVRDGLGVSLLPDWLIQDQIESGELVRVLPAWAAAPLPVHVVYAGQRVLPVRVTAFIDHVVRHLKL